MPVRSTSRIAFIASRSETRGRWQPNGCDGGSGKSGSIRAQTRSGIRQPSSATTRPITPSLVDFSNEVGLRYPAPGPCLSEYALNQQRLLAAARALGPVGATTLGVVTGRHGVAGGEALRTEAVAAARAEQRILARADSLASIA